MGEVPFVKLFTKSIGLGMSEIHGSTGFGPFRLLSSVSTSGPALSTMRERGAVGLLRRFGTQALGGNGVTHRLLRAVVRGGRQTAQDEQRQGLRASAAFGGGGTGGGGCPGVRGIRRMHGGRGRYSYGHLTLRQSSGIFSDARAKAGRARRGSGGTAWLTSGHSGRVTSGRFPGEDRGSPFIFLGA